MIQKSLVLAPPPRMPCPPPSRHSRLVMRPGRKMIRLSASNGGGGRISLVFVSKGRQIELWRSLDSGRLPVTRAAVFPGPLTPRAVADLLAAGEVEPWIDPSEVGDAVVERVDGRWSSLIRLAWSRVEGRPDPRVKALLALGDGSLAKAENCMVGDDPESYLDLGAYLVEHGREWLGRWRSEIDAEVARRAERDGCVGDDLRRRALRNFIETCLLTLGRVPHPSERAEAWAGASLRGRTPGKASRRKLGLDRTGRVRRFQVKVVFWTGAETYGYSDFGPGPGWYWIVCNPDPNWRFCDPTGPYKTPEKAWDDAGCLGQDE